MRRTTVQYALVDQVYRLVSPGIEVRLLGCAVIAGAVLTLLATSAHADFGPKPINQVRIDVRLDGKPIGDEAIGVLLVPAEEGEELPGNAAKKGPGLVIPYVDGAGRKWSYGGYLWGGAFRDGRIHFHGFFLGSGGMPSQVRLAVIVPGMEKQLVTNAIRPTVHYAILDAELSADGRAELRTVPTPLWARLDFLKALIVTVPHRMHTRPYYCDAWKGKTEIHETKSKAWYTLGLCVFASSSTFFRFPFSGSRLATACSRSGSFTGCYLPVSRGRRSFRRRYRLWPVNEAELENGISCCTNCQRHNVPAWIRVLMSTWRQ